MGEKKVVEEKIEDEEEIKLDSIYGSKDVLTSGNTEVDKKMGGGIPAGSLTLIEGANDTGKSVLTQQLMWGGLQQGFRLATYTTENTIKSLLRQMDSLSLDISDYFVFGNLKIYPIHLEGVEWTEDISVLDYILNDVKSKLAEVVLIDSLTVFVADAQDSEILRFFSGCVKVCNTGKTILITAHTFAFEEEVLTRVRSICDAHLSLKKEEVGDRLVRTIEVAKIRGAQRTTGNVIAFEVEPAFGLRIIPVTKAKV